MMHTVDIERNFSIRADNRNAFRIDGLYHSHLKRGLDILLVVVAAPVVLAAILLMAALVTLDGRNPFYSQLRVGRNGKEFRIWKIRTMIPNADTYLQVYLAAHDHARREWDATQKLKQDPRITRVGRVLRKCSMDELPQLWNVLTGSMSLIGPRPMMVCQKEQYPGQSYFQMRPGITGLWQISDRNNCDFVDRAVFDDIYARTVSFVTDLRILLKTMMVVVRATGH